MYDTFIKVIYVVFMLKKCHFLFLNILENDLEDMKQKISSYPPFLHFSVFMHVCIRAAHAKGKVRISSLGNYQTAGAISYQEFVSVKCTYGFTDVCACTYSIKHWLLLDFSINRKKLVQSRRPAWMIHCTTLGKKTIKSLLSLIMKIN